MKHERKLRGVFELHLPAVYNSFTLYSSQSRPAERNRVARQEKKLLDQVRDALRRKHYAYSTEQAYLHWIKRFILFHGIRHRRDLGAAQNAKTSMILRLRSEHVCTHVLNRGGLAVRSPLDL